MVNEQGFFFPPSSCDPFGVASTSSSQPQRDWWAAPAPDPLAERRRSSTVLPPTNSINYVHNVSPGMRTVALQNEIDDAPSTSAARARGFSLSKVFGTKKVTKDRSASVGAPPNSIAHTAPLPTHPHPASPLTTSLPLLPPLSPLQHQLDFDPQSAAAARRQEYARQLATSSGAPSNLPGTQTQGASYYRHRVNEPYQPSARFAAALSVGFSPAQANAVLAPAPFMTPPTKYGMPRLPRGTLTPDKVLFVDWALAVIASEREQCCQQPQHHQQHTSDQLHNGKEHICQEGKQETHNINRRMTCDPIMPVDRDIQKQPGLLAGPPCTVLGLDTATVAQANGQKRWTSTSAASSSNVHQLGGATGGSPISCASSSSPYLSASASLPPAIGALNLGGGVGAIGITDGGRVSEECPKPPSLARSGSGDSTRSSANSHRQSHLLADLASEDGTAPSTSSSCEDTNETEMLLDEGELQSKRDRHHQNQHPGEALISGREGLHLGEGIGRRRRSSIKSGTLATVTSPVSHSFAIPSVLSRETLDVRHDPKSPGGGSGVEATLPTAAGSTSSSFDAQYTRRPSWTLGRGRSGGVGAGPTETSRQNSTSTSTSLHRGSLTGFFLRNNSIPNHQASTSEVTDRLVDSKNKEDPSSTSTTSTTSTSTSFVPAPFSPPPHPHRLSTSLTPDWTNGLSESSSKVTTLASPPLPAPPRSRSRMLSISQARNRIGSAFGIPILPSPAGENEG